MNDVLPAVDSLLISVVMLRRNSFGKDAASLGIVAVIGVFLSSVSAVGLLIWSIFIARMSLTSIDKGRDTS